MPGDPIDEFQREKWRAEHQLESDKFHAENKFRDREIALKEREQGLREEEVELKKREAQLSRWTNPLAIAIFGAAFAGLVNAGLSWLNNEAQVTLERGKAADTLHLEQSKAEAARILEMIKTSSPDAAAVNLDFLLSSGLIADQPLVEKIKSFLDKRKKGTGPYLSGRVAFSVQGECKDNKIRNCDLDATGKEVRCFEIPC